MSNNKQSSVEWYAEQFAEHIEENYGIKITSLTLLNKAKEMCITEHEKTWNNAISAVEKDKWDSFEQYYNETFNDAKK